jgi:hypothetical protein
MDNVEDGYHAIQKYIIADSRYSFIYYKRFANVDMCAIDVLLTIRTTYIKAA